MIEGVTVIRRIIDAPARVAERRLDVVAAALEAGKTRDAIESLEAALGLIEVSPVVMRPELARLLHLAERLLHRHDEAATVFHRALDLHEALELAL